jgi:hypothetical protein
VPLKIGCAMPVGVTSVKVKEQSAGNLKDEKLKMEKKRMTPEIFVSIHLVKHKRPCTDEDLGYYLAGLIEGDGYVGERGFEILFHENDIQTAYYIKQVIGYGSINKVKNKRAYKISIFHRKGVEKLWNLVNGKFQGPHKIAQATLRRYDLKFGNPILKCDDSNILKTYWLAGFADADGNFYIFISQSQTHALGPWNITIPFRVTQKHEELLKKIQNAFQGGVIYKTKNHSSQVHRYSTVTFSRAVLVAHYFDKYHMMNHDK